MNLLFQRSKLLTASAILAALALFCWATVQATQPSPGVFDTGIRACVQDHESRTVATFLWVVTRAGSPGFISCLALFAAWREHRAGNRAGVIVIAVTVVGAFVLDNSLKYVFHRARPAPFFGMAVPPSFSYPSGHSLWSASFYGSFAAGRMRFPLLLLIAMVGFSRFYLGVHYPSDVVGGLAVGAAWAGAVMLVFNGRQSA